MIYVGYVSGNDSEILAIVEDKEQAYLVAEEKKIELQSKGAKGIISVYEITNERGMPMKKVYHFLDLNEDEIVLDGVDYSQHEGESSIEMTMRIKKEYIEQKGYPMGYYEDMPLEAQHLYDMVVGKPQIRLCPLLNRGIDEEECKDIKMHVALGTPDWTVPKEVLVITNKKAMCQTCKYHETK